VDRSHPSGSFFLTGDARWGVSGGDNNGEVNNAARGSLQVLCDRAIFTDNLVKNGSAKITGTTVTFAGTFTNGGTYFSSLSKVLQLIPDGLEYSGTPSYQRPKGSPQSR